MKSTRYLVPFATAASLFAAALLLLIRHGLHQDGGMFVYPLDDAYIHMSVARNLALHGVWGISPYSFSGASSSPLWTLLLAAVTRVAGTHLLTPLVVNAVAALLLLLVASIVLARALPQAATLWLAFALCVMTVLVPLPGLALIGMEHVLHSLAMLCLLSAAAWVASVPPGEEISFAASPLVVLFALAAGALRYESCFAIAAVLVVLLIRRRILLAAAVAVAAAVGPLGYAVYSFRHSGIALPFSVVMKASGSGVRGPYDVLTNDSTSPLLLLLTALVLLHAAFRASLSAAERGPLWTFPQTFACLALATTLMHSFVGPVGWLMRYEAYLYVIDTIAATLLIGDVIARRGAWTIASAHRWVAAAMLMTLTPAIVELTHRAHHGYSDVAVSVRDRYVAHLAQALFVSEAMPHAAVIANDIGFLAYYAPDVKILDPLGLGSIEPVRLQREHQVMTPAFMQQWASKSDARVAILHTDFPGAKETMIPTGWVLVESWCFPHNLVFLNHVETFYASGDAEAQKLRDELAAFHQTAPELVRYRFPQDGTVPPEPPRGETAYCPAAGRR